MLLISSTTDPEHYTDSLDWGWTYRSHVSYETRGKAEARFVTRQLHYLREREQVSSLYDHGIRLRGSTLAFFVDEATSELLGTCWLTFLPDRPTKPGFEPQSAATDLQVSQ